MISSKPRLKVFITFLEKLTQLTGYNFFKDFRQEGEVGYRSVVDKSLRSWEGFFRRGLITAILKDCGTYPEDNDRLIVFSNVLLIRGRIS